MRVLYKSDLRISFLSESMEKVKQENDGIFHGIFGQILVSRALL